MDPLGNATRYAYDGKGNLASVTHPDGVPRLCVECYMAWKAKLPGKLFGDELSEALPDWGETTELMLSDQAQIPYPALVPDLTSSAKRSTLYSALWSSPLILRTRDTP